MTGITHNTNTLHRNRWRIIGWGAVLALLLTPLVAMQFTAEVNWTASDFVFAIIMFGTVGLLIELGVRMNRNPWYRAGVALGVFAGFALLWVNAAVGLIGNENSDTNMLFLAVPLVALTGAVLARFRGKAMGRAMANAMFAAGLLQIAIATIFGTFGSDPRGGIFATLMASLWLLSGALFRNVKDEA